MRQFLHIALQLQTIILLLARHRGSQPNVRLNLTLFLYFLCYPRPMKSGKLGEPSGEVLAKTEINCEKIGISPKTEKCETKFGIEAIFHQDLAKIFCKVSNFGECVPQFSDVFLQ